MEINKIKIINDENDNKIRRYERRLLKEIINV